MTLKAVFFDLDGTLLDSAPDFIATLHRLTDEYQAPKIDDEVIRSNVSDGARALTRLAFGNDLSEDHFNERHQRLLNIYHEEMGKNCVLFPGMHQLLNNIKQEQLFWGVITNKPLRFTDPIMERIDLPHHPNLVLCPDHVTNAKPDPEALLLACKKVNCQPSEAIYIGDHKRDIDCGLRAGSPTIAVSFGYIKQTDNIDLWNAKHIANNSDDIWKIIQTYL